MIFWFGRAFLVLRIKDHYSNEFPENVTYYCENLNTLSNSTSCYNPNGRTYIWHRSLYSQNLNLNSTRMSCQEVNFYIYNFRILDCHTSLMLAKLLYSCVCGCLWTVCLCYGNTLLHWPSVLHNLGVLSMRPHTGFSFLIPSHMRSLHLCEFIYLTVCKTPGDFDIMF